MGPTRWWLRLCDTTSLTLKLKRSSSGLRTFLSMRNLKSSWKMSSEQTKSDCQFTPWWYPNHQNLTHLSEINLCPHIWHKCVSSDMASTPWLHLPWQCHLPPRQSHRLLSLTGIDTDATWIYEVKKRKHDLALFFQKWVWPAEWTWTSRWGIATD